MPHQPCSLDSPRAPPISLASSVRRSAAQRLSLSFRLSPPLPYASGHLRRTAIAARVPHPFAAQTLADAPDGSFRPRPRSCDFSPGLTSPQSTRTYRIIETCYYYTRHGSNSFSCSSRYDFPLCHEMYSHPASASALRCAGHCRRLFTSAQVFATRRELAAWPSSATRSMTPS